MKEKNKDFIWTIKLYSIDITIKFTDTLHYYNPSLMCDVITTSRGVVRIQSSIYDEAFMQK